MLQRSISRRLSSLVSIGGSSACTLCKCSCGRQFLPDGGGLQQKRSYEPRQAGKSSHEQKLRSSKLKERESIGDFLYKALVTAKKEGAISSDPDNVIEFLDKFEALRYPLHSSKAGLQDLKRAVVQLAEETGISYSECYFCALLLLKEGRAESRVLGKRLMYTFAHLGSGPAIVEIMQESILEAKTRPTVLKNPDLAPFRATLKERAEATAKSSANNPEMVPYLVLEGQLAYMSGDVDRAIELWTRSLEGATAKEMETMDPSFNWVRRFQALYTPWLELGNAWFYKGDLEKARWAMNFGCEQDDPISHFNLANYLERRTNQDGDHVATSSWLYHMTKAAGSGYARAAHALGNWYGSSGWKFIEDEPPDHVKPTPFDSYPSVKDTGSGVGSFWNHFKVAIGLKAQPYQAPQERVFITAVHPSTSYGRFKLAMQWLEASMGLMYAPSYLIAARLLLQETLWSLAAAPKEAIELSDARYLYASRDDYVAGTPIANPADANEAEIPNPGYDPGRAKELIRQVFFAVISLKFQRRRRDNVKLMRKRGRSLSSNQENLLFDEDYLPDDWPAEVRKWFRFPETREMYVNEQKGILWDDELQVDLEVSARKICDEQGWDIYDEEGGLMYRHRAKPT